MRERRRNGWIATSILLLLGLAVGTARELTAQEDASAMLRCYQLARDETLLDSVEAQALCRGADSLGPISCYLAGDDETFLDTADLIELCRCADSTEPIACYVQARTETDLWAPDARRFCSPIFVRRLWPDCTPRVDSTSP